MDAFCGCGTAIAVAQKLNRRWIGVDITHLAITLLKYRLADAFGDDVEYEIIGEPKDEASARALAVQDRYQFQWWALSLIRARPYQGKKKGADEGVDGVIYYQDVDPDNPKKALTRKIVIQVKSGKVSVKDIQALKAVVKNQDAVIDVFITLNPPTGPMLKEATTAGRFHWLHVEHPTYPNLSHFVEIFQGIDAPSVTAFCFISPHRVLNFLTGETEKFCPNQSGATSPLGWLVRLVIWRLTRLYR